MSTKIKVTPQDLQYIINEMSNIKDKLRDTANGLKYETSNIASIWNDDQSQRFLENVGGIIQRINARMDEVEIEKNRIEEYRKRTDTAARDMYKQ
jgi:uncharacterized protein YukE